MTHKISFNVGRWINTNLLEDIPSFGVAIMMKGSASGSDLVTMKAKTYNSHHFYTL